VAPDEFTCAVHLSEYAVRMVPRILSCHSAFLSSWPHSNIKPSILDTKTFRLLQKVITTLDQRTSKRLPLFDPQLDMLSKELCTALVALAAANRAVMAAPNAEAVDKRTVGGVSQGRT
jgi:hypothetical protein